MFKLGALPSEEDYRDFYACSTETGKEEFPENYMIDIDVYYNQQASNCVVQCGRVVFYLYYGKEFEVNFPYAAARSHEGEGLIPNIFAKFVCKNGMRLFHGEKEMEVPDLLTTYNENAYQWAIEAEPYSYGWRFGRVYDINTIKGCIKDGNPVLTRLTVNIGERYREDGVWDLGTGDALGGHEVLIVGWRKVADKEYAIIKNSWGSEWGENGNSLLEWSDALKNKDCILITNTNGKNVIIRRTLIKGMQGADVDEVRRLLKKSNYKWLKDKGVYNFWVSLAVRLFQRKYALEVNGIVNKATLTTLGRINKINF